MEIERNDEA